MDERTTATLQARAREFDEFLRSRIEEWSDRRLKIVDSSTRAIIETEQAQAGVIYAKFRSLFSGWL